MNQLNKEAPARECPDILRNISDFNGTEDEKCKEKLIPAETKEMNNKGEPWKTKDLGELVPEDTETKHLKKRRRQRKLKKGLGWTFWVTCAPLAVCFNCIREQPEDPDDPLDWNDDPLRPWRYKVDLPRSTVH